MILKHAARFVLGTDLQKSQGVNTWERLKIVTLF